MSQPAQGKTKKKAPMQLRKTPISPQKEPPSPVQNPSPIDALGELPHGYGLDTIFLTAQDPRWLFTYWDIDISRHPGGPSFLRVYQGECVETEIEVPFEARNWYIPAQVPGGHYTVEIGFYRNHHWNVIARSAPTRTPPDRLSDSDAFVYANIPLHLHFQKLMEALESHRREEEPLSQTMARLQKEGQFFPANIPHYPPLSQEERNFLEALLGGKLIESLSSEGLSSEELEKRIQAHLQERLNSEESSFLLTLAQAGSGELFGQSSWGVNEWSSWAAGALSSWKTWRETVPAPAGSSWIGSETLASGGLISGAETSAGLAQSSAASWSGAGATGSEQWSGASWGQAVTSWPGMTASSWGSSALSSWGESSWSSGAGASDTFAPESREFFLNVNAEVIFYGCTDPRARLTIGGKPVALNPDGTFRSHCLFPNGTFEIPIVATSPDGVETRSAVLRFDRATAKTGQVEDTRQPPFSPPPGQKL